MTGTIQNTLPPKKTKIFLLYNPKGVVDKDIYLCAKGSNFHTEVAAIDNSVSPEGHTLEKLDLLNVAVRIAQFKPDLVLTINGGGLDNDGLFSSFCAALSIPLVLWYVDEPFLIPEWGIRFIPETTIGCTFDRYYEKRLKGWGMYRVFTLPLGTNPERLLSGLPADQEKMQDTPTLSFVGSLEYKKIRYLLKNIARLWRSMPPNMVSVLEKAIEQYRKMPVADAEEVIAACAGAMGVGYRFPDGVVKQMVLSFLDREASFRQRREIIEGLKPLGISVFGEPFWEKVVGKPFYKGRVDYYSPEIVRLYRSSRINLNISKYQLKTTVNQRVFDCPLCDGFLISDYREEISNYFEIDKSMVVYSDLEDLVKKITYYLDHEKEATRIIEEGKGTVLDRHTYGHRLEEMSNRVNKLREDGSFQRNCEQALKGSMPASLPAFLAAVRQEISSHHADNPVSLDMPVLDAIGPIERFIHG